MLTLQEVISSLYGAWRLARFDARGMAFFDTTLGGFWRSFFAAVLVAPAYVLVVSTGGGAVHGDTVRFGLAETIGYILSWVAFPVVMEWLTRQLGCRARYLSYITAYNWASVIEHLLLLPVLVITARNLLPDAAGQLLWLVTLVFIVVYAWFVTRTALAVTTLTAAAIVFLDIGLSYVITLMTVAVE